jgi:hypothetical protein
VRGFSAVSLLPIDEAARVEEWMYKALRPMRAMRGGDLCLSVVEADSSDPRIDYRG